MYALHWLLLLPCIGFYWCKEYFYRMSNAIKDECGEATYNTLDFQATKSWHKQPFIQIIIAICITKSERYIMDQNISSTVTMTMRKTILDIHYNTEHKV